MKRRQFLQRTAASAAGLLMLPAVSCSGGYKDQMGLQLYTLRESIFQDPKQVLKMVADCGYKELETFAYEDGKIYGMPFAEFGSYVDDLGMKVVSGHYGLDLTRSDSWEEAISDAKSIGQKYMVVPYLNEPDRKNIDDYKKVCEQLNKAGETCNKLGMRFGYHNHAFEFESMQGEKPFDLMLAELDPDLVGIELDIYWVVRAGEDPTRYFDQYPGRFEQWHVKDMDKTDQDRNSNIGQGTIDYKALFFDQAKLSGMKHWYVEQESYPGEPIESVRANAAFLRSIL